MGYTHWLILGNGESITVGYDFSPYFDINKITKIGLHNMKTGASHSKLHFYQIFNEIEGILNHIAYACDQ